MYAIVDIAGQQFKIVKGQSIFVHRLEGEEGANVEFDKVLLSSNEGTVKTGHSANGIKVSATITKHLKGDKVIVFKKKRRKGYRLKKGHRQALTQIVINDIA
jgi:large subunit ribosomal protein L21